MDIEKLSAKEVLEVISEMSFTSGKDAIIVARAATGKATGVESRYAVLFLQDKCAYCDKRPIPHFPYEHFEGYIDPPILLGHFCDRGGTVPKFTYHVFEKLEYWERWNAKEDVNNPNCEKCTIRRFCFQGKIPRLIIPSGNIMFTTCYCGEVLSIKKKDFLISDQIKNRCKCHDWQAVFYKKGEDYLCVMRVECPKESFQEGKGQEEK